MSNAPLPEGYSRAFDADCSTHSSCILTVGIEAEEGDVEKFVVRLHRQGPGVDPVWTVIGRFDHNATDGPRGHDLYEEGLHVDVATPEGMRKARLSHGPLPEEGTLIRSCMDYLRNHVSYFIRCFEGTPESPDDAPDWVG